MLMKDIVDALGLSVFSGEGNLDKDVTGGIISDMLSDVMAQAQKGALWVTNQTHENVLAIVFFKSLAVGRRCGSKSAGKKFAGAAIVFVGF